MKSLPEPLPTSTLKTEKSLSTKKSKALGRPSGYDQAKIDQICEKLANGESLRNICKIKGFPSVSMVMRWLWDGEHLDFREQYAKAREQQAESIADEIVDIADENPTYDRFDEDGNVIATQVDGAAINRNRLRVDARKWVAAKLLPKKYGEKIENVNPTPVNVQVNNVQQLAPEFAADFREWVKYHRRASGNGKSILVGNPEDSTGGQQGV